MYQYSSTHKCLMKAKDVSLIHFVAIVLKHEILEIFDLQLHPYSKVNSFVACSNAVFHLSSVLHTETLQALHSPCPLLSITPWWPHQIRKFTMCISSFLTTTYFISVAMFCTILFSLCKLKHMEFHTSSLSVLCYLSRKVHISLPGWRVPDGFHWVL